MTNQIRLMMIASASVCWAGGTLAAAQGPTSTDSLVDVNEAIYYFLQGDQAGYDQAISLLSGVLQREPQDHSALLFRGLSHGQIGLLHRTAKLHARNTIDDIRATKDIRDNPERQTEIQKEIAELTATIEAGGMPPAELAIAEAKLADRTRLLARVKDDEEYSLEQLNASLARLMEERDEASHREKDAYRAMSADLGILIDDLDHPTAVIRLLEVVAQSKIARLNETEAMRIKSGDTPMDRASGSVSALRASSRDILKRIALTLEALSKEIGEQLTTEDAVRCRFFLGVIRYRQAIPRRTKDETAPVNYRSLRRAESIMTELADGEAIPRTWRSYAALYLGLIIPFRANLEPGPEKRDRILNDALERLLQAATLSSPEDRIPELVGRQRDEIARLRALPPGAPQTINDLQITVQMGAHRDTNVVLLGDRTDLPRGISNERDFGFTLGTAIDYTLTLSDRWTLGLQGRVTQLWHVEVDEFDEQRYGGSVAFQYELKRQQGSFGPVQLRLQYDYDYTLLGREAFLESHRVIPNIRVFWANRRAEANLSFRYETLDYREPLFDKRFDRDGNYFAFAASQSYKLLDMAAVYREKGLEPWGHRNDDYWIQEDPDYPARFLTPFIGIEYSWDSTQGDEFDLTAYALRGGVLLPLPWGIDMDASFDFEWQNYNHGSLIDFHRRPRRDFVQRYGFGLSRTFVLRGGEAINRFRPAMDRVLMTVRAHASFTHDDSNVVDRRGEAIFEYDRTIFGLSVAFAFN